MQYPRLTDLGIDKRKKLSDEDIKGIRELRSRGESLRFIADKYGIAHSRVYYYCASVKKQIEMNKHRYELLKAQVESEPELIEKRKKYRTQQKKDVLNRSEAHRKYQRGMIAKAPSQKKRLKAKL